MAQENAAKKVISDSDWQKMTFAQKQAAHEVSMKGGPGLTEDQAENLESLEEAAEHAEMLEKQSNARIPRALTVMRSIGDLMNHKPTEKQRAAILAALEDALKGVKERFSGKTVAGFQLPKE